MSKNANETLSQFQLPDGSVVVGTFADMVAQFGELGRVESMSRDERDMRAEIDELLRPWAGRGTAVFEPVRIRSADGERWDATVDPRPPAWLRGRFLGAIERAAEFHHRDFEGYDQGALALEGAKRCLNDPRACAPSECVRRRDLFHVLLVLMSRHPKVHQSFLGRGEDDSEPGQLPGTFREGAMNALLWLFEDEDEERISAQLVEGLHRWMKRAAATVLIREEASVSIEHALGAKKRMSQTVRLTRKVGRNDPCPCGSETKFKKCCGRNGA